MEGRVIGQKYRIEKKIGQGGMGVVYSGIQLSLDRPVAIKALTCLQKGDEHKEKLKEEARTTAQLAHPNIVQVYDVIDEEDTCFLIMELVQGETLKEIIQRQGPFPIRTVIEYGLDICSGLDQAHSAKPSIIHRDIKPANIMLDQMGKIKIMDFGIAIVKEGKEDEGRYFAGSAPYISPEQANGESPTPQSDLYSLGIVLYEMLTGKVPFIGESVFAIIYGHMNEEPISPSEFRADLTPMGERAVLVCLNKNPNLRFKNSGELKKALLEWRSEWKEKKTTSKDGHLIGRLFSKIKGKKFLNLK